MGPDKSIDVRYVHAKNLASRNVWIENWLDCIDLLGATELERHVWRLRTYPCAFIAGPMERKKGHVNNFAQLLRKIT